MSSDAEMSHTISITSELQGMASSLANDVLVAGEYHDVYPELYGSVHKVPSVLLERNITTKSLIPKLISIGPYHHGMPHLKEMESVKLKYLHDLTRRHPANTVENYIKAVEPDRFKAMSEYSNLHQLDPKDFVRMMVVDGCFILEFLLKWFLGGARSQVSSLMTKLVVLKNDLLLVENQIPFFILQLLLESSHIPDFPAGSIWKFEHIALKFITGDERDEVITGLCFAIHDSVPPDHLLHLYHKILALYSCSRKSTTVIEGTTAIEGATVCSKICNTFSRLFTLLYSLLTKVLLFPVLWVIQRFGQFYISISQMWRRPRPRPRPRPRWRPLGLPNARKLRDTGFAFHKRYGMDYTFMDISPHGQKIKIPALQIDESMQTNFQNLIALEHFSDKYGKDFTAYALLLDYLIDSAEDVAILKEQGIIDNRLGDDQKVADFFNNLCGGIYLPPERHHPLLEHVTGYYEKHSYRVKFYWWRKMYVPDYFTNPWAVPSMIAALILLVLSALQTFYSIYPNYSHHSQS